MEDLFDIVASLQINNDEKSFEHVLNKFSAKINKYVLKTHSQQREDLKQELNIIIYNKVKSYPLDEIPGFDEFEKKILNKPGYPRLKHKK